MYCSYYQATALRDKIWCIAGILRNENHWCFDRSLDEKDNLLEFFVAPDFEEDFLSLMEVLKKKGYILSLEKLPNRCKMTGAL